MTRRIRVIKEPADEARSETWRAWIGDEPQGSATVWTRPDDRAFIFFERQPDLHAKESLLDAISAAAQGNLYVTENAKSAEALELYSQLGFAPVRREWNYLISVDEAVGRLSDARLPESLLVVSAGDVDLHKLRLLDDRLRQDVPGTDGWRWDPAEFQEETLGPYFDPALYLVAVDRQSDDYIGLVRVWNNPARPRIGMFGVVPSHRRRGIVRGLLAPIFAVLSEREVREVVTEADVTNKASTSLLVSMGARKVGEMVELMKPGPEA